MVLTFVQFTDTSGQQSIKYGLIIEELKRREHRREGRWMTNAALEEARETACKGTVPQRQEVHLAVQSAKPRKNRATKN